MTLERGRGDRRRRIAGAAIALLLAAIVLKVARPAAVWELLRHTDARGLLPAAAAAAAALVFRGLRLVLLLPPARLRLPTATLVAAAAQAAALFVPARAGELALPLLLRRSAGWDLAAGIGTLLAARTLDVAALGIWAGASILAVWGFSDPVALVVASCLLAPLLLLPLSLATLDRLATRVLAPRGRRGRRWTRRLRRLRRSVSELRDRPLRLLGAALASLVMWAWLWSLAWILLDAMGYRWSPAKVVAGSAAASIANLLPFNTVGNLGTLEAGWTAAFVALGVPTEVAAATGFASHLWALFFAAIFGAAAWGVISIAKPKS